QARAAVILEEAVQLEQRLPVDVALEVDHGLERYPVVVPAPGIELGMAAPPHLDVAVAPAQPQQVPDLLLPSVARRALARAPRPALGHLVAHPLARAAEHADMAALQADLLLELAIHRLRGSLAMLDAALRELPGVLIDT